MFELKINAATATEFKDAIAALSALGFTGLPAVATQRRDTIAVLTDHAAQAAPEKTPAAAAEPKAEAKVEAAPVEPAVPIERAAAEVAKTEAPAADDAPVVTYADVQQAVFALHKDKGRDVLVETLGKLGVTKAQELSAAQWPGALAALKAAAA